MERYPSSMKESASSGLSTSPSIAPPFTSPEALTSLIEKRISSWLYVQQSHSISSEPWFQTAQVSRSQVERHLAETLGSVKSIQKTRNLFVLGMSLGPILAAEKATDFCRSLSRVMDEWEVWNEVGLAGKSTGMGNGVKNLFRNQRTARKSTSSSGDVAHDHSAGSSNAQHGTGALRPSETALIIINVPFALDYCQVVMTLCDIIRQLYTQLRMLVLGPRDAGLHSPSDMVDARGAKASSPWAPGLMESITKADQKLKKILHTFVRDMEQIAQTAVNHQLESLIRNLSATSNRSPNLAASMPTAERSPVLSLLHEPGVMTG